MAGRSFQWFFAGSGAFRRILVGFGWPVIRAQVPKLFLAGTFWWHLAPSAVQAPSKEPLASALVLFGLYNASFRGPLFSNVEPHSTMSRGKRRGNTSHSQIHADVRRIRRTKGPLGSSTAPSSPYLVGTWIASSFLFKGNSAKQATGKKKGKGKEKRKRMRERRRGLVTDLRDYVVRVCTALAVLRVHSRQKNPRLD